MKNPKEKTYDLNGVRFLTITGMSEKLQCNPQTVQRKVAQKKIRYMRYLNKLLSRRNGATSTWKASSWLHVNLDLAA